MSVLDIIVLVVLALGTLIGLWKGFLRSLLNFFGNMASLVLAFFCAKPVGAFLDKIFKISSALGGKISNAIVDFFAGPFEGLAEGATVPGSIVKDGISDNCSTLLKNLIKPFIDNNATYESASSVANHVGNQLGYLALLAITVIVMFILVRIAVLIISKIFDALTKGSAISGLDRLLGGVVGLVKSAVFVFAVLSILYAMSSLPFISSWFDKVISDSTITLKIYQYIQEFFTWLLTKFDIAGAIGSIIQKPPVVNPETPTPLPEGTGTIISSVLRL